MLENKGQKREIFLAKSLRAMQENIRSTGSAADAGYTLIASILLLGGIGYGLDAWRGTSPWFLISGLLVGLIIGFFLLAKIIWPK
jgi:F0F1-type ATP synthase assembly protein I